MSVPDIVTESLAFYKIAEAAESAQRRREKEDLACQTGEGIWPEDVKQSRGASRVGGIPIPPRPMLSVATMDEPVQLVLNQEKAAHLGVNIHPLTEDASDDTAVVLQDLYRQIETDSRANLARDWAFDRSTKAGRGVYEIRAEYDYDTGVPGDQKLVIKRLLYQTAAYFDPFAQEPDWSDGERALVVEDMPFTTYKRRFSKSAMASLDDSGLTQIGTEQADWIGGDGPESRTVRLAKYYYVEHASQTVEAGGRTFEHDTRRVKCCLHNAIEVLERYEWGGKYIPLVPTIGRELQPIGGERRWIGMIHNAKDGARLTNYAASGAVEIASLEPKAPFELDPETIEGYEEFWQNANTRNFPYLPFHRTVNGQPVAPPQRVQIDVGRLGPNMTLLGMGKDFVQSAMATFDPALGKQPTAHRSGRAIVALQDQTVEGTSHYVTNLADISMTYEAMVILDAIPYYYDRPGRILTLRNDQDKQRRVMVNAPHTIDPQTQRPVPVPMNGNGGGMPPEAKHYDLKKGRYGVTVTISKSYKSRLEQGQNELGDILTASPELMPIIGPEYFKFRDTPGGQEIARLLKKMRDHQMPWLSDDPNIAAGSLPQLQQENAELKQKLQEAEDILKTDALKQRAQIQIATGKDQTALEVHRMDNETKLAVAELGAKIERLSLFLEERTRLGVQAHDVGLASADHGAALQLADQAHQQTLEQQDQAHQQALAQGAQDTMAQGGLAEQAHGQALEQTQQQADLEPEPSEGASA